MPEAFSLMISDFGPHFTHVIAVTVRHFLRKSLKYAQVQQTITFKTQKKKSHLFVSHQQQAHEGGVEHRL